MSEMDFKILDQAAGRPPLYEKGDSVMWTNDHISGQILEMHLNPEMDLASRVELSIDRTVEFILLNCNRSKMRILDLGCGPGLYAERLAKAGHHVTGVDFSESSIRYASDQAKKKNLIIDYHCLDYLTLDFKEQFDLVLLIYTDFGVLIPSDRAKLLHNIYKALKPDGRFIFDVINTRNLNQKFQEKRTWTYERGGFWNDQPYLELQEGFKYPDQKVFLHQHIVIDQTASIKTYRFWTHYFDPGDIEEILADTGFNNTECFDEVLPATGIWNGDNITFYRTEKK